MKRNIAVEALTPDRPVFASETAGGSAAGGRAGAARFDLQERVHAACHTLTLAGELDDTTAPELRAAIARACDAGATEIVLDLHELASIDAAGLRLIMTAGRVCDRYGCDFALARVQAPAQKLFDFSGAIGRLSFRRRSVARRMAGRDASRATAPLSLFRPDFEIVLDLNLEAPRSARNYVRDLLGIDASSELRETLMLLTSEIVTPIVERGAPLECGELVVWLRADLVRVEFRAPSRLLSPAPEPDGRRRDTDVLNELADRWSIDAGGASACIWIEVERRRWERP